MTEPGHVVFYVRDVHRSVRFYSEIVGLEQIGQIFKGKAVLLSGGRTHHELLLIEVGNQPGPPGGRRTGLYHIGWKIGETMDELKSAYTRILANGIEIDGMSDHTVSKSIYLRDPDGNEVELFIDDPDIDWRNDKSWMVAPVKPLDIPD